MFTNKQMMDSLRIAKSLAPIDSGNLRHNAIKLLRRRNGFTIKYSGTDAYYISFVEDGTSKQNAQGFIAKTYLELSNYFANVESGRLDLNENIERKSKINMELYRENPDYRRLIHRQSIFQHYQNENTLNRDGTPQMYKSRGE